MTSETLDLVTIGTALANAVNQVANAVVRVDARPRQAASGVIWSVNGLVVTASHIIEREDDITVTLADGESHKARLLGRDPDHDIALLQLPSALTPPPATLCSSVTIGQLAVAVARPTVRGVEASLGVISALDLSRRTRTSLSGGFIRTDLTMYPGFSGAALTVGAGEVAGVLSSHIGDGGYAVSVPEVNRIVEILSQHGHIRRAYLGFRSQSVVLPVPVQERLARDQRTGLVVLSVETASPAETAGLMVSDLVVGFGDEPVRTPDELQTLLTANVINNPTPLTIIRGGAPMILTITPAERQQ